MRRAVFDCMIFLQAAARSTGPAAACLQAVRDGRIELVVSPSILAEVRDVLTRPKTLRKFPALTVEAVELFVQEVENLSLVLPDAPRHFALPRDPKDEPYINLAVSTNADYLATRDRDLLDLMDEAGFRQQFPGLSILDPPSLLGHLASP